MGVMPAGLVRSDPTEPGITRRRRGRGWTFADCTGNRIDDPVEIARIKDLVIPPAWRDVWICADPRGHIQAVGTDAAGRRQYRYHDDWRTHRDGMKHDRVLTLGRNLHAVRAEIRERLAQPGLGRDRVLAAGVRMLDSGVFRPGGEEYTHDDDDEEGTFGLATIRREHVSLRRGAVIFNFPAKGGIERTLELRDPPLHKVCNSLLRRRGGGDDLLAYKERKTWIDVRAEHLNEAVKELAGDAYTCKDLRTWSATVHAAVALALAASEGVPRSQRALRRAETQAVTAVAEHLGNTPTVARASYVDPRVMERFEDGRTVLPTLRRIGSVHRPPDLLDDDTRARIERAVARLIDDA